MMKIIKNECFIIKMDSDSDEYNEFEDTDIEDEDEMDEIDIDEDIRKSQNEDLFEEDLYQDEFNVNERAGGGLLDADIMADLGVTEKDSRDPIQRFALFVRTVATNMTNQGFINLNLKQDVSFMIKSIANVPKPEYKNPTGYVLGYWLVSARESYNSINKKRFIKISSNLKKLEFPLEKHDAIRYARFWILHNLLK